MGATTAAAATGCVAGDIGNVPTNIGHKKQTQFTVARSKRTGEWWQFTRFTNTVYGQPGAQAGTPQQHTLQEVGGTAAQPSSGPMEAVLKEKKKDREIGRWME